MFRSAKLYSLARNANKTFSPSIKSPFKSLKRNMHSYSTGGDSSSKYLTGIIGANVFIFVLWNVSDQTRELKYYLSKHFTLTNFGFFRKHLYHTTITSFFSHRDLSHLIFNMLTLASFGYGVLSELGKLRFSVLYFGGGIVSSLCQIFWPQIIPRDWPASRNYNSNGAILGASGAINAVVIYTAFRNPLGRVYLFGVLPLPMALLGAAYIGVDAYNLYEGNPGIGNAAHLGGAFFGSLMFLVFRNTRFLARH